MSHRPQNHTPGEPATSQASPPLLDYGCTPGRLSSQRVYDLYASGVTLWTKDDFRDIEHQLEQSLISTVDRFTVRGVDGRAVHIKNPWPGVQKPIWTPFVSFNEYWRLVLGNIDGPSELLYCSYLVDWRCSLDRDFRGNIENWQRLFECKSQLWKTSITCDSFKQRLREVLAAPGTNVTKILCFGLGDMVRKSPEIYVQPGQEGKMESQGAEIHPAVIQHAVALTMAEEARTLCGGTVRLLAQDPQYTDDAQEFLTAKGFEIVGKFGAEGFTYIDDECIVFSAWPAAPVKQIVADFGRPAAIITLSNEKNPMNRFNKPFFDPESPRTRQMWLDYQRFDFPTSPVEIEAMKGLDELKIFVRRKSSGRNV